MEDFDRNANKTDQAYESLKHRILNLELPPGYPLREVELSEMLHMSRTPVRSAIKRLTADGFAESMGANRIRVSTVSADAFNDIFQLREVLEDLCVSLAACTWHSMTELEALRDILKQQEELLVPQAIDSRAFLELDRKFHHMLATLSGNHLLAVEMIRIYDLYWRYIFYGLFYNRSRMILQEHKSIVDAIEKQDSSLAQRAMRNHLERAKGEIMLGLARGYNPREELQHIRKGYSLDSISE